MAVYELIHNFVEVLDKYFSRVVRPGIHYTMILLFENFSEEIIH